MRENYRFAPWHLSKIANLLERVSKEKVVIVGVFYKFPYIFVNVITKADNDIWN